MTRKQLLIVISILLLAFTAELAIALSTNALGDTATYLGPALAAGMLFTLFSMFLKWRVAGDSFGDLGFVYVALVVAYTIIPALAFIVIGLDERNPLAQFLPSTPELGRHLWRHVLFLFGVSLGYLLARGREGLRQVTIPPARTDTSTVGFLIVMTAATVLVLTLLSAPVTSYYENYTRYEHLSWFLHKIVSVCIRLNFGIYTVLLVFLFINYKKYKFLIPIIVATICLYETIHSFGSRIYAFVVLLTTAWLYHAVVKPISFKKWIVIGAALIAIFTVVEVVRPLDANQAVSEDALLEEGIRVPYELGAVFLTSFHLYQERERGALPAKEWPMLFSDLISVVTFGDFTRWNPMDWYTRNYYPDALVPPLTLGPIADSAIWGGEPDLLVRGLINGIFFAYLVRWFLRRRHTWWGVSTYVYCYAAAVLTIKYSVFYILTPLVKTVLPTLLLTGLFRNLISIKRASLGLSGPTTFLPATPTRR